MQLRVQLGHTNTHEGRWNKNSKQNKNETLQEIGSVCCVKHTQNVHIRESRFLSSWRSSVHV